MAYSCTIGGADGYQWKDSVSVYMIWLKPYIQLRGIFDACYSCVQHLSLCMDSSEYQEVSAVQFHILWLIRGNSALLALCWRQRLQISIDTTIWLSVLTNTTACPIYQISSLPTQTAVAVNGWAELILTGLDCSCGLRLHIYYGQSGSEWHVSVFSLIGGTGFWCWKGAPLTL